MSYQDLVEETTTATSMATIPLLGAYGESRTFAQGFSVGATGIEVTVRGAAGKFESGTYTLTSSSLLTRTAVRRSSNSNAAETFAAGTKMVSHGLDSDRMTKLIAIDAATVTTVGDSSTSMMPVVVAGVQKMISVDSFIEDRGDSISELGVAGALASTDLITLGQGGVEKQGTLAVLTAYLQAALGLTDTTAPSASSAQVANASPTIVQLQMSETMSASFIPAAGAFTVSGHTVSSVGISGSIISLTLSAAFVYGETPRTAGYTQPGTNNARDSAGNLLASFSSLTITNNVASTDTTAPTFSSAQVADASPTVVQVTMSETLGSTVPATSAWAASGKTVTGVSIAGSIASITVSVAYAFGDTITITYTQPGSNKLQDAVGNFAASFGPSSVTNNVGATDTTAPTFSSAVVENAAPTQIVVTMSETLAAFTPTTTAFTLSGGKTCSNVARSGATLTLTADSAYANGDTITFSYVKPGTNQLRDAAGNETASFGPSAVTNNVAGSTPAAVTSLASPSHADNGITLTWVNGSGATGWTVKQRLNSAGGAYSTSTLSTAATATGCVVSGLAGATAYDFEVTTTNASGSGPATTLANITTNATMTVTGYNSNVIKTTMDGTTPTTTQSPLKGYDYHKHSNIDSPYWSINGGATAAKCGWGTSSTVPPAEISGAQNIAGGSSINGMSPMSKPGQFVNDNYLWITSGSGTSTWYFWVIPTGGHAQCMNPSGMTVTSA